VHFAHLNRPVLGDEDYGGGEKWLKGIDPSLKLAAGRLLEMIDRPALHAQSLTFTHPMSGQEISVSSHLPEDMEKLVAILDEKYR
jgi:23S rRNA pseudouridine1911/1915/1917 synthase